MRQVIIIFLLLLLCCALPVSAKKLGTLEEVLNPEAMALSEDHIYVVQEATFFVYRLKDLKLLARFGKKGEGPGELKSHFLATNTITPLPQRLLAQSMDKMIFFSNDDYTVKKEMRKKHRMMFQVMPLGDGFISLRMLPTADGGYQVLELLGPDMSIRKELHRQFFPEKGNDQPMIMDAIHFALYRDKIFVEKSGGGFRVDVYDTGGVLLYSITKDIVGRKVTKADKTQLLEQFKKDKVVRLIMQSRGGWEAVSKTLNFVYAGTFPAIRDLLVADDRIYLQTFERKKDRQKYVIMDLKGNHMRSVFLPAPGGEVSFAGRAMGQHYRFFDIRGNRFYYLKENEEEETWEVHVTPIPGN